MAPARRKYYVHSNRFVPALLLTATCTRYVIFSLKAALWCLSNDNFAFKNFDGSRISRKCLVVLDLNRWWPTLKLQVGLPKLSLILPWTCLFLIYQEVTRRIMETSRIFVSERVKRTSFKRSQHNKKSLLLQSFEKNPVSCAVTAQHICLDVIGER